MWNLEKKLFKLYLLLLPITSIELFNGKLYSLTASISSVVHFIGMVIILINIIKNNNIPRNSLIKYTSIMIFALNISSIIMALLLKEELGAFIGRTTIIAIIPQVLYYLQIFLVIYYNFIYLNKISIREIKRSIELSFVFILIVGYIQILIIITKNLGLINLYSLFEKTLHISSWFIATQRVALLNTEASMLGCILSVYILPFIYSNIIICKRKTKYIIMLLLFLPIAFYAKSSTVYIGLAVSSICFIYLYWKKNAKFSIVSKISMLVLLSTLLIVVFININSLGTISNSKKNDVSNNIWYLSVDKVTNFNNLSTIHRNTSVYTNFKAFEEYPILGVGNGNQGFFYVRFFPDWGYNSYESIGYLSGKYGWPGSGGFFPTYISAYGIVGIILLIIFIYKCQFRIKKLKGTDKEFYYHMYIIGSISFIFVGYISVDIIGTFYILFTLSLPFISVDKKITY